ncbi:hypothetical protein CVT24_006120 [Panaeolus cyanescens]|uniref:Reverse transcriptase domain-containing protein n=1 Tax=Panaeolus cyanescens TaxID=181874 RepID=A0A409YDY1_9AGAR|nr:hypothetical protein CVT24_006120 [Panaeolus cyanescens]
MVVHPLDSVILSTATNTQTNVFSRTDYGTGNGTHLADIREGGAPSAGPALDEDFGEFGSRLQTVDQTETDPVAQQPDSVGGQYQQQQRVKQHRVKHRKRKKHGKKTKAHLKICSLNINGGGSEATRSKWDHINQIVRENNISITVVQETHLTPDRLESILQRYKRLHIIHTYDQDQTNSKGVAFVINKYTTRWKEARATEVEPGRAMILSLPWREEEIIHILGIYAPNPVSEQIDFWEKLKNKILSDPEIPNPDFMIGDFNMVENKLDRLPPHADDRRILEQFHTLKDELNLSDTWRAENPTERKFTYLQKSTGSQSRIDRIYTNMGLNYLCDEWTFTHTGIPNCDHKLIGLKVEIPHAPFIGQGRWAMAPFLLKDKQLINKIKSMGQQTLDAINQKKAMNTLMPYEIQSMHEDWKQNVQHTLVAASKKKLTKIDQNIRDKERELKEVLNKEEDIELAKVKAATIEAELAKLNQIKHTKIRDNVQAKFNIVSETIGKEWINANKEHKSRDIIYKLKIPSWYNTSDSPEDRNQPTDECGPSESFEPHNTQRQRTEYTTRSEDMALIVAAYHEHIQGNDITPGLDMIERQDEINTTLTIITRSLSEEAKQFLSMNITQEEIQRSINSLPCGKSPGLDGLPKELYKALLDDAESRKLPVLEENHAVIEEDDNCDTTSEDPSFDLLQYLKHLYDSIQNEGMMPQSKFAEGWMCPIYKKNDRKEIANYRPITVLNTDYKIFTRALTSKLGSVANNIIHPDQAGFMVGRRIENHTDLIHLLTNLCTIKEENGAIICLDQEKAYDRIRHDFLWATLQRFNFPNSFIETVKSLYQYAETSVMINGVLSPAYKVTRGVRQGDPLSCLLFNLAIESLAEALRQSNLKGLQIDDRERLIASLFADDTTVYLSQNDDIEGLYNILERWCSASGAKFNVTKTEIIPLGSKEYRENLIESRKINQEANPIRHDIHIAETGEPVRVLGAWVGHEIDQSAIWQKVIDDINDILRRWNKGFPTQEGRRLIVGMYIAGKTQYLARVQGMPEDIEDRIQRIINQFMWDKELDNFSPPIKNSILTDPIESGGRKVLDLKARNEAINIMKIKTYLSQDSTRPPWTRVMDEIVRMSVPKSSPAKDLESRINTFLQTWKPTIQAGSRLPKNVISMLKTALKYKLTFNPNILSDEVKSQLPIWHHIGLDKSKSPQHNREAAKCLRLRHKITKVGQMSELADLEWPTNHREKANCFCEKCVEIKTCGCLNPQNCAKNANRWINALHPKWNPRQKNPDIIENPPHITLAEPATPRTTHTKSLPAKIFRADLVTRTIDNGFTILGEHQGGISLHKPAAWAENEHETYDNNDTQSILEAEVVATCTHEYEDRVNVQVMVWIKDHDDLNRTLILEGGYISSSTGELAGIRYIAKVIPNGNIKITTKTNKISIELDDLRRKLEKDGQVIKNKELIRSTLAYLRARIGQTILQPGTCPNAGNILGAREIVDIHKIDAPENFRVTGLKLVNMTQATAYRAILEWNENQKRGPNSKTNPRTDHDGNSTRRATKIKLDIARHAVLENVGSSPTDEILWRSLRNKTISKNIRAFMWTAMHNGQKCGEYWTKMTNLEHRGQNLIWELAQELLKAAGINKRRPSLGDILSAGVPQIHKRGGATDRAKSRLYTIVITESAHLIWKLRCEWRIGRAEDPQKRHTNAEIRGKWYRALNTRLKLDCLQTNTFRYGNKSISKKLVKDTWKGTLEGENDLPDDWVRSEVLVGIRSFLGDIMDDLAQREHSINQGITET